MPVRKLIIEAFVSEESGRWCVASSNVEGIYAEGATPDELIDNLIYLASEALHCDKDDIDYEIDLSRIFMPSAS
jgi:hypothetical protein